jgi:metal-sulfur cluster biosynthetic enzyme
VWGLSVVESRARVVEEVLRSIVVPGFDVDLVTSGVVRRYRVSRDGEKVAVFIDFTRSDPNCLFCKFINHVVWRYIVDEIKRRLREAGFKEVYVVDEWRLVEL